MLGIIPTSIVIGIIEDKIANDITGDSSVKEHLEDVKEKIFKHKPKLKKVKLYFDNGCLEIEAQNLTIHNGFVEVVKKDKTICYNSNDIKRVEILEIR